MLDDMFPFIEPIVESSEDDMFPATVTMLEAYFDLMQKKGIDRTRSLPPDLAGAVKPDVPLDIALSMLKPEELEKLRNYVTAYLAKHPHETE